MQFREFQPRGAAAQFVERYWLLECPCEEAGAVQRVVPDGSPELILNLADPLESLVDGRWQRQPRSFLAGQITGPLLLRQSGTARILGVRFFPHGAGRLLGSPMTAATSQTVRLDDLSPALSRELEDACDAPSAGQQVARLELALSTFERRYGQPDLLVEEAVRRIDAAPDVGGLARELGVSTRQLQRRFAAAVGLGPKHFARMRRFQKIFPLIEQGSPQWASAALACGYFDQAHLIRDFKEFAGEAPAALLQAGDLAHHFLSHFSKTQPAGMA